MTKTMMKTTILSLVAALGLVATSARADDPKVGSGSNSVTSDSMNANKKDDIDRASKKSKSKSDSKATDPSATSPSGVTGSSATSPSTTAPVDPSATPATPPPAPPK